MRKRHGEFFGLGVHNPRLETRQNLVLGRALDREDEGESELGLVGIVERSEAGELLGAEGGESGARLFAG